MERKQEALSDNLANIQTPGYKKDDTVMRAFPNLLIQRIKDYSDLGNIPGANGIQIPGQAPQLGELANGVYAQERIPSFTQGALTETGRALDFAIDDQSLPSQMVDGTEVKGAAFFTVMLQDGSVGYTKNGKFDADASGQLVTSEGYRVLGTNGQPIQLPENVNLEQLRILGNGELVLQPDGNGAAVQFGQLAVAVAENPADLRRLGGNVYQADGDLPLIAPGEANGVSVQNRFLEQSNVDSSQTITEMMMAIRSYEANQKVISAYDKSLEQLNTVGRLNG